MIKELKNTQRAFLAFVSAFTPIYATLFTPSLPLLVNDLNMQLSQFHLPMTSFILGCALGQPLWGILSNRYGRKPALFLGILLTLLSCLICIVAAHIAHFNLFIFSRILMGIGSGIGLNTAFAVIGDVYSHEEARIAPSSIFAPSCLFADLDVIKLFSFTKLFSSILTGSAVSIGGLITEHLGWSGCFYFLTAFGGLILLLSFYFPETSYRRTKLPQPWKTYIYQLAQEVKNSQLIMAGTISGCGLSMLLLFTTSSPFIAIHMIGLKPDEYSIWALMPSLGLIVGYIFAERIAHALSIKQLLSFGRKILFMASLFSLGTFYFGHINPWSFFFPMLCIDAGLALVFASTSTIALTSAKNKAYAGSIYHFIQFAFCSIFLPFLSVVCIQNPVLLPLIFLLLALTIGFLLHRLEKSIHSSSPN